MPNQQQSPKLKEIYRLIIEPGLWSDYTHFSAPGCVASQWFRFYHRRLKKMGGYRFVGKLNAYTLADDFLPYETPYGNAFTEPSYPSKQYSNQDLGKPWNSDFLTEAGIEYDQYSFTSLGNATFYDGFGISSTGYRIPRKILAFTLDDINKIIVTSDYNQDVTDETATYGGIAFADETGQVSHIDFVDGLFPAEYGYVPNKTYIWSLEYMNLSLGQELAADSTYIIAHASCGNNGISDETNSFVFIIAAKNIAENKLMSPLAPVLPVGFDTALSTNTNVSVSGGVCVVGPFVFAYGNNGLIRNSDSNNALYWADPGSTEWQFDSRLTNDVNVCNSKIVKGVSYKGMGTYSALFWSLDSLILATFVGAPLVFSYTIIATNISIIAPNSVVERAGTFFWIGDGRFFVCSGAQVSEVQNIQNRNWFFSNVNNAYQHLIWGCLNPEYSEIWWFFPFGDSTECDYALIYNYEDNIWNSTKIDRGAGVYASIFSSPIWATNKINEVTNAYDIFIHETGTDAVDQSGNATGIPCSFTTGDIGSMSSSNIGGPKTDYNLIQNWTYVTRVEPDGLFNGTWLLKFITKRWARDIPKVSQPYLFGSTVMNGKTIEIEHVDVRIQGRIMQLEVNSNTTQSDFYLGNFMIIASPGDAEGI